MRIAMRTSRAPGVNRTARTSSAAAIAAPSRITALVASALALHRVDYGFSADAYAQRPEGVDMRHKVSWTGTVTPAASMSLSLQLGAGYGRLIDLNTTNRPGP